MPKIKNILIFLVIAILLVLGYIFFIKKAPDTASLISSPSSSVVPTTDTTSNTANVTDAQDFLTLLLNVSSIKLDDSIFSDPAFTSLHDSSIVLVPDPVVGRPNPFAPSSAANTAPVPPPPATPPPATTPAPASTSTTTGTTNTTPIKP